MVVYQPISWAEIKNFQSSMMLIRLFEKMYGQVPHAKSTFSLFEKIP